MFASLKSLLGGGGDPAFPYTVDGGAPVVSASAGWQLLPGRAKVREEGVRGSVALSLSLSLVRSPLSL